MELNTLFNTQQAHAVQLRIEPLRNRKERLKKLLSWVLNHEKEIKDALRKDLGKPEMESDVSEIFPVISEIRMALANIGRWTKPQFVDTPLHFLGSSGRIHYVPKGVCLILSTWNFPFNLSVIPLISALTAGNSVILKPSEISPNTSKVLKKMCDEVFDPKVVAVVEGGIEVSQELLNLPFNHMYFVGSTKVGKIVMEAASKHLASVTLELGGKSPSIVDESADLADAAQKIIWGKYLNCGQVCIAPDYLYVHEKVKDRFIEKAKKEIERLYESNQGLAYGKIVSDLHFDRLQGLFEDGKSQGGKILHQGDIKKEEKHFAPHIIDFEEKKGRLFEEEIFGPILPVLTFGSTNEVIDQINAMNRPLALYVFAKKKKTIDAFVNKTISGSVVVNDVVLQFTQSNLPFGGINSSGIGTSHGIHGFKEFSHAKSVLRQRTGFTLLKLLYPPYTGKTTFILKFLKKFL